MTCMGHCQCVRHEYAHWCATPLSTIGLVSNYPKLAVSLSSLVPHKSVAEFVNDLYNGLAPVVTKQSSKPMMTYRESHRREQTSITMTSEWAW